MVSAASRHSGSGGAACITLKGAARCQAGRREHRMTPHARGKQRLAHRLGVGSFSLMSQSMGRSRAGARSVVSSSMAPSPWLAS